MFADLDETIRQLLIRYVPLDLAEVDVSFEAPDREWSGRLSRPTINCFLYAVQENLDLRQAGWDERHGERSATRRRLPLRIDASYQVTAWARAPEDEHRLLWRVLAALARHAVLPPDVLQGALKEQPFPVPTRVARPDVKPQLNPADLWQALDNRIRPALSYVVTLALQPDVEITSPLVLTRTMRLAEVNGHDATEVQSIGGRVRDSQNNDRGIAGATVALRETGVEVTTDEEGCFTFARAPLGQVTLLVRVPDRPEVVRTFQVPSPSYDVDV